jgi:arsenate reductase (glutaredoxin)
LRLLQERGIEPTIVEYLKTPLAAAEIKSLLAKLKMKPDELMRKGENEYRSLVAGKQLNDAQLVLLMSDNPILIERPIAVMGDRAVIGRPPENVLQLLK